MLFKCPLKYYKQYAIIVVSRSWSEKRPWALNVLLANCSFTDKYFQKSPRASRATEYSENFMKKAASQGLPTNSKMIKAVFPVVWHIGFVSLKKGVICINAHGIIAASGLRYATPWSPALHAHSDCSIKHERCIMLYSKRELWNGWSFHCEKFHLYSILG